MPGDSESYGLLLLTVHVDPSKIFGRPQKYVYNKTAMIRMCYLPSLDLYAQQPTCVSPDIFVPHTIIPWQIPPGEKVARGDIFVSMLYAMFSAMLYAMFHLLFNPMLYAVFIPMYANTIHITPIRLDVHGTNARAIRLFCHHFITLYIVDI